MSHLLPTAIVGPVIERLMREYNADAYLALSDRAGVHSDTVDGIVRQQNEGCEFDIVDRLLCAANAVHLWRGELAPLYESVVLLERCQCPGCQVRFVPEKDSLGRFKRQKYCSQGCNQAAYKMRQGRNTKRMPKSRRGSKWALPGAAAA